MTLLSYWRKHSAVLPTVAGSVLVLATLAWAEDKKAGTVAIAEGKQVSLEYTLTLEDKSKVDSNVGKDPLVFTQGAHDIVPGLEKKLVGLKVGDSKRIEVPPEEGYGPVKPELKRTQEVPKDKVPADAQKVGSKLVGQGPGGQPIFAEVTEIKNDNVVLSVDGNHPLAGKKLIFDVKVLKVEDAPAKKVEVPSAAGEKPAPKGAP